MEKRKSIFLDLFEESDFLFSTPVGSPDVVVGLLSCLAVPGNDKLRIEISLKEIEVPAVYEKENN